MAEIKTKITVKHYLNKRAKAKTLNGEKYYPLYLQLIVSGQKAQLKSKISEYLSTYKNCIADSFPEEDELSLILQGNLTENFLLNIENSKSFPLYFLMNDEIIIITYIIRKLLTTRKRKLSLSNFTAIYDLYLKDINIILDEYIKEYFLTDLHKLFAKSDKKDPDKLFKISDYFIHYIDWEKSFCSYYKRTCEVLPKEISLLESHLNEDLKKNIKALIALNSSNNFLVKHLNKAGKGRFPCSNYLDWVEKGKDFITLEFIKAFGRQKALEYVNSLDVILSKEVNHY